MPSKLWAEITDPLTNVSARTVKVWEWLSIHHVCDYLAMFVRMLIHINRPCTVYLKTLFYLNYKSKMHMRCKYSNMFAPSLLN